MREPKLTTGEVKTIKANEFRGGIFSVKFKLGSDFSISKSESTASLCLISSKNIFYETSDGMNILIVKEGGRIPYFSQLETWGTDSFPNNELNAVVDLRTNGLYGSEFRPEKINDGRGNFGYDFSISITPQYFVYFNKQNAQEEIKKRLDKIRNKNIPFNWAMENILNENKAIEQQNQKEDFKEVNEKYKQFTLENYKEKSKDINFLAAIAEAIKSDYSADVKVIMVKDIVKRYDKN